jgi:D-3-phosphoglycerate dehydrogenase
MHAGLAKGRMLKISVKYDGEVASHPISPITVALVKGLLEPIMAENVNYVNACILAQERGIKITESKSTEPGDFSNLIDVSVTTSSGKLSIAGTIYAQNDPRIVLIDGLRVELRAEGNIVYIANKDIAGMVGKIGTVLGRHRVNIADMTLGRDRVRGMARTLISVDAPISDALLKKIRGIKNIVNAQFIKLS